MKKFWNWILSLFKKEEKPAEVKAESKKAEVKAEKPAEKKEEKKPAKAAKEEKAVKKTARKIKKRWGFIGRFFEPPQFAWRLQLQRRQSHYKCGGQKVRQ